MKDECFVGVMSCGVLDGCAVRIVSMMRGGGKHRNRKNRAENKTAASAKNNREYGDFT